jgi:hypothetical protein
MKHQLAGVCAALLSAGCHAWKPVTMSDLSARPTARVWVTPSDQSVVTLVDAQVFRGKLVGFVDGKYREFRPEDLRELRVRQPAPGRTASLVAAGALGLTAVVVLLSGSEDTYDPCVGGPVDCAELTP